jgi:hypothetical protein
VVFLYFECDGTILACYDPQADGDGRVAKPLPEPIYIAVDDLESAYARAEAAGPPSLLLSFQTWARSAGSRRDRGENVRSVRRIHSAIRSASLPETRRSRAVPRIEHENNGPRSQRTFATFERIDGRPLSPSG